jgi:hypothetical protein
MQTINAAHGSNNPQLGKYSVTGMPEVTSTV